MVAATNAVNGAASTGSAAGDRTALAQNYDTFLKLLTTQLQNQDPLTPMDSAQFTNQLVLFSQVEQQIAQNGKLSKMMTAQTAQLTQGALGYIGLDVQTVGGTFAYKKGSSTDIGYALPDATAKKLSASITNAKGDVVWLGPLKDTTQGAHTFTWDGKDINGSPSDDGNYNVTVTATDADGKTTQVQTSVPGRVTGIQSTSTGVMLNVGSIQIPMDSVITAKKPSA